MPQKINLGDLYAEKAFDHPERGAFAVVLSKHIDGNVADVYGETEEEAQGAAQIICDAINALNWMEWWMASSNPANVRDGSLTAMVIDGMTLVDAIRKQANPCPICGDWHTVEMAGKDGKGYRMCQECDHTWQ